MNCKATGGRPILALLTLGLVAALFGLATPDEASAHGKVTLCHLADGPAQAGLITVDKAAAYHGHYLQHSADVIPPFQYQGNTYSLNWTGSFPEICGGPPPPPPDCEEDPQAEGCPPPPPPPDLVRVCDPKTGEIIEVPEDQAGDYLPVDDPACQETPPPPPCEGDCTP